MTDTTSATLLGKLRDPTDRAAWERFVELYTPLLFRWGRRLGLPAEDAADLVQETLLTLVRRLPEFDYDPDRSFRAWLATVARNAFRDRLRKRREGAIDPQAPQIEPAAPPEDRCFEQAEYRAYLYGRALDIVRRDFAEVTWQACRLALVTDRPAADIGAELGLTEGAVYAAKYRILKRLRTELAGLLDD